MSLAPRQSEPFINLDFTFRCTHYKERQSVGWDGYLSPNLLSDPPALLFRRAIFNVFNL